jgi:uncharacterized protein YndB with AHSA1/START domain
MAQTTTTSRIIHASPEKIYRAFGNPEALENWQAPADMTAKVHDFEFKTGGGYEMSLYYPDDERETKGKTSGNEDRFTARFIELVPHRKIVQSVSFASENPGFSGEMIMEVTLEPVDGGTNVTYFFRDIPEGIRPEDNEAGTISTLEKLARFVE